MFGPMNIYKGGEKKKKKKKKKKKSVLQVFLSFAVVSYFLKQIYCTESIYSVYKDILQNCSCNQFD